MNGPDKHPGANYIRLRDGGHLKSLQYGELKDHARALRIGDVVERHLHDGDVVLFNRQPSLHKMSIMSHEAKILKGKTLRFNECVCAPYNADFDGDEMNLHVPQTEEARAEARQLMAVQQNLISARNGSPLVTPTQDFITASFLMTQKDVLLTREQMCNYATHASCGEDHIDLPPPCLLKPVPLWTGKQLWSLLLRPNAAEEWPDVNLETKERHFEGDAFASDPSFCPNEGHVLFATRRCSAVVWEKYFRRIAGRHHKLPRPRPL